MQIVFNFLEFFVFDIITKFYHIKKIIFELIFSSFLFTVCRTQTTIFNNNRYTVKPVYNAEGLKIPFTLLFIPPFKIPLLIIQVFKTSSMLIKRFFFYIKAFISLLSSIQYKLLCCALALKTDFKTICYVLIESLSRYRYYYY
jgi:hypothetical protein